MEENFTDHKIAIIGLGYVGLPLAVEFAKKYQVLGFDTNVNRVNELNAANDVLNEVESADIRLIMADSRPDALEGLKFSAEQDQLKNYNTYIVTVPTPIDQFKAPNLDPLLNATEMLGSVLKKGDLVIYESTVYPGCTEEECIPLLEKASGLKFNNDFFVGYSPERINPGDKINTLTKIKKVTSGSTPQVAESVDKLYASIIEAGTHKAPSIKVAEASKAIENAQRDVNISFVNELALIFDRMNIDTNDVLDAAATKWNFLRYRPGLVGGHCIGVDPYYLAHKAQSLGYHPEVILSGRRVNDNMGVFVANKVVKLLINKGKNIANARALILGITFKENCADIRNSRVVDIYHELCEFKMKVDVYDPLANAKKVKEEYDINIQDNIDKVYDAIVLAVAHDNFKSLDLVSYLSENGVIFDSKAVLPRNIVDARL
ncbi:nucleotide sugar dehydrogenase [Mucilaginibacter litoreus]|uniref:Nucleotide sugar dehydrogenase n=1 Tax=Mucilaginibacter litoreus TaxID=1048221 RepID=A0ABW3AWV4_9SPHI